MHRVARYVLRCGAPLAPLASIVMWNSGQWISNQSLFADAAASPQLPADVVGSVLGFLSQTLTSSTQAYKLRVRALSPPDKVFAVFASMTMPDGKTQCMSISDFASALIPLTDLLETDSLPTPDALSKLVGPSVLTEFDVDGDGRISFPEFLFFLSILAIPRSHMAAAFAALDRDGSGAIDAHEFSSLLNSARSVSNVTPARVVDSDSKTEKASVIGLGDTRRRAEMGTGILHRLFGPEGKGSISRNTFDGLLSRVRRHVRSLEFSILSASEKATETQGKDLVSASGFALAIVSYAPPNVLRTVFAPRLASLPLSLSSRRVSLGSFLSFHDAIDHLVQFAPTLSALQETRGSPVQPEDLVQVIKNATDATLELDHARLLCYIFAKSNDASEPSRLLLSLPSRSSGASKEAGFLDFDLMADVLRARSSFGLASSRDTGVSRAANCVTDCLRKEMGWL
ncbi:mitochondrial EF-hand calcium-binding protein [Andalucia godoyi]|uniref:Mitochondrial EF-hand calcium-binding protein n=1 Tax=Andalucia godoyi TaxID=505711 RepID=A0A8K0F2R5_ANDGO|nr:mitochondrial EF-hand calcium-binding protein [Andalucia godoyi]|eukprot:ANDGO_05168.mRNA.1 mitochondrial EF-hand calcium-binding protein (MICU1 homolog)